MDRHPTGTHESQLLSHAPVLSGNDFHGWDFTEFNYISAYLVTVVALLCAVVLLCEFGSKTREYSHTSTQFTLFGLFVGLAFGFGGAAHHALAIYYEHGHPMSMLWFHEDSEWLVLWTVAMFFYPLSSTSLAGVAIAVEDGGVAWIRVLTVLAFCVGLAEIFESFKQFEAVGFTAVGWAVLMCVLALVVTAKGCFKTVGASYVALGATWHLVGLAILIFTPKACWDADRRLSDGLCQLPFDMSFNPCACFNVLALFTVISVYFGAMTRLKGNKKHSLIRNDLPSPSSLAGRGRCCTYFG